MPATALDSRGDWSRCAMGRGDFVDLVEARGAELYRDLPWRNIDDPYGVLVSEIMLQQTQVARVMKYWDAWMEDFPTVSSLAKAETADVLGHWQGLGYNRRALALKRACETCADVHGGTLPATLDALVALPGVGPATAAGVLSFAYNMPSVYIETNVRTVFLHELFPERSGVPDKELAPFVRDSCPGENPRSWYYALLDYGAHLKSILPNPSRRSRHHTRQGRFEGSHREKRSFVLKRVLECPGGIDSEAVEDALDDFEALAGRAPISRDAFESLVEELEGEGFFRREGGLLIP